jgi:UDP-N-acetylglucosamine transferase subunit ALG13
MILILVSTGHFDPLIEACNDLRNRYDFFGQIGMGYFEPQFRFVRTAPPSEIQRLIKEAEIVISHGGTGMLSQLYQYKKPTIIVPKQVRYGEANDSQVELAVKWAELGMGILCMDVKKIRNAIEKCRQQSFSFPEFRPLGKFLETVQN